jgi:hypothetical protein
MHDQIAIFRTNVTGTIDNFIPTFCYLHLLLFK